MAKSKVTPMSAIVCRFHESEAPGWSVPGLAPCGRDCQFVGTMLDIETRLLAIQSLADGLCHALVEDGREVFPGMPPAAAAEALRILAETLFTEVFSRDEQRPLEDRYESQAFWLLDRFGLIGERKRNQRLTVERVTTTPRNLTPVGEASSSGPSA